MARIRLYKNTRFNGVNVPYSLSIVKNHATLVVDEQNANLIQAEGLGYVDIQCSQSDASSVDFCIVNDDNGHEIGYKIASSYETQAPGTVRFNLSVAALSTILPTVDIISGSAERLTIDPELDETQYFTNIEPFAPAEMSKLIPDEIDNRQETSTYNILETISIPPRCGIKEVQKEEAVIKSPTSSAPKIMTQSNADKIDSTGNVVPQNTGDTFLLKQQTGGYFQYRELTDALSGDTISIGVVGSLGDDVLRKLYPTQLTLPGLSDMQGKTFSTGSRWWLEEDLPSKTHVEDKNGDLVNSSVVNDLRTRAADNNIVGFWGVPNYYVQAVNHTQYDAIADGKTDNYGGIKTISAAILNNTRTLSPYAATHYEPVNNKAVYGQCCTVTIFNPVSGQSITKQLWEISDPTNIPAEKNIEATYSIAADLRKEGCPIFCWKFNNGTQLLGFPETLKGGNWRQIPVSGEGGSGSYYAQLQLDAQKNANSTGLLGGAITALGAVVGGVAGSFIAPGAGTAGGAKIGAAVGTGLGMIGGAVVNYFSKDKAIQDQEDILSQQGQMANVVLSLSSSNYVRDCGYNKFYGYYSVYSDQDLKDFDMFLTKFGYNVGNKEFTKDDLLNRPSFNYIKANNVHFTGGQFSTYLLNAAADEMKRGVRIWHELPSEDAYLNGNKE